MNKQLLDKVTESIYGDVGPRAVSHLVAKSLARRVLVDLGADDERHIAYLTRDSFTLQHPIHERLLGSLADCDFHQRITDETYDVTPVGDYYVSIDNDELVFVKKED